MTRKRQPKPSTARSLAQLGVALGVTPQSVHAWTRHPDWPFARRGPWPIDAVRRWRADALDAPRNMSDGFAAPPSPEMARARAAYLIERALRERQRREIESGALVAKEAVERRFIAAVLHIRTAASEIIRPAVMEIAARCPGFDTERAAAILERNTHALFTMMGGGQVDRDEAAVMPVCDVGAACAS